MEIKLWGMSASQISAEPQTWGINIRRGVWRQGDPVKVGLNIKLLNYLVAKDALIVVNCLDPQVTFSIPAWKFKKGEVFFDKSVPSGSMEMRLIEIPRTAYQSR